MKGELLLEVRAEEIPARMLPGAVQASSGSSSSESAMAEMMSRQFARIGTEKYAAQFDFDRRPRRHVAHGITGVNVQHVRPQQFNSLTRRMPAANETARMQIDSC